MKKKIRKFASGGDILTALGAGLAGYGAYKYLTRDKGESKDDDYTRRVKEYGTKGKFPEEKSEEKADAKKAEAKVADDRDEARDAARERALRQSKDPKSNLVPEGADRDALYESDKALVRTDRKGAPVVKKKNDKPSQDKRQSQSQSQSGKTSKALQTYNSITAPSSEDKGDTPKSPVFKSSTQDATSRARQAVVKAADSVDTSVPKAIDLKGTNKTVYGTDTTSVFQRKAAQERADKEAKAKREAEAEKRRRSRPSSEEMMTQSLGGGFKRGGAIKASKMGSVKTAKPTMRSASARADGIAIRGKTRA